ncbi:unnamed protein product [Calypogeia fissa]
MSANKTYMDTEAAARVQAAEAKKGDGTTEKGGFAARAQATAAHNANTEKTGGADSAKK